MEASHRTENGSRLGEFLREKEKSQRWLAQRLGVEEAMVSRWATGRVTPLRFYRKRIADELKVPERRIWPNE